MLNTDGFNEANAYDATELRRTIGKSGRKKILFMYADESAE